MAPAERASLTERLAADRGGAEGSSSSRRTRTTRATSSSRSGRAPAATRRRSSRPSSSGCTSATPRGARWKVEIVDRDDTGIGGLKDDHGDHRGRRRLLPPQVRGRRPPRAARSGDREPPGRIHTSAATVAVLPEAEDVEVKVEEKDIRVDRFCASGPGGPGRQHDLLRGAAHAPADGPRRPVPGRAQPDQEQGQGHARAQGAAPRGRAEKQEGAIAAERKKMVGSGDRSEKIRTYNFPQSPHHRPPHRLHDPPPRRTSSTGNLDELVEPARPPSSRPSGSRTSWRRRERTSKP